ncbi:MAG: hypothetical protein K2I82_06545 [Ruminococcus sp.]|nr:hypothetical protein [Ruminococcus sp.]
MADTIDVTDFTKALVDACTTYTDDVKQKVHKGIRKISREAKAEVVAKSPKGKVNLTRDYKHYKDGWTTSTKESNGVYTAMVHNKKYQLVHLLELGHLNRDGTTRTQAFSHVEPAEKETERKVDKLLEDL